MYNIGCLTNKICFLRTEHVFFPFLFFLVETTEALFSVSLISDLSLSHWNIHTVYNGGLST